MKKNEMQVMHDLSIDIKVDQNDLVNVAVADQEVELVARANFLKKEIYGLRKEMKTKADIMDKKISDVADSFKSKEAKSVISLLDKLGIDVKCTQNIANRENMFKDKKIMIYIDLIDKKKSDRTYYVPSVSGKQSRIAIPKEIIALNKEIQALDDRVSELAENRLAVTAELRNIPSLERQVKAKISRGVLEKHEGGREFLKKIKGTKALLLK